MMNLPKGAKTLEAVRLEMLVERAKGGDTEAFDQLYGLYRDRIYNYVARMIHDPSEAEDITQEAFIRAYRNLPRFRGASTFKTWLYRIAGNLTIDAVRRRQRRETYSLDSLLDTEEGEMRRDFESNSYEEPQQILFTREVQREVHSAVGRLSRKLRNALVLYEFMGLSYEEIAEIIGCPLGTVKSRLFHARYELGRLLVEAGLLDWEEFQRNEGALRYKYDCETDHREERPPMPWLDECGHWAVYPAFVQVRSDANRWGICLKQTELGHISYAMMMQGSDKCWECGFRIQRKGSEPVASDNPPCGAYRDWKLDARGRPIGTCEPTSRRSVLESDMIAGDGCCQGCSKRTVEADESLTTFRRKSPRKPRGETVMHDLPEAFRRRIEEIGDVNILRAVNDRGFPGSYIGNDTVKQYFSSRYEEILAEDGQVTEFAKALGFEAEDLKNYLTNLAEQTRAERIAKVNGKYNPLELFEKLCRDPQELEIGEGTSVWAVTARVVRAAIAGECPLGELTAIAEKLEVPPTVVLECGLDYLERWGEFTERPSLNLPANLAEALEAFQGEERCTFLRRRISLVKLLLEELLGEAVTGFLASLASDHPAIASLNEEEGNEIGEDVSVRSNLATLKYY